MTKDVTKEDSQPKYTEIAYQLLKTFAGQCTNSGKQHNKQLNSAFIMDPDYWRVFASGFHVINTSDQEARSLYTLIFIRQSMPHFGLLHFGAMVQI